MFKHIFKYRISLDGYKEIIFLVLFYFTLAIIALAYVAHSEKTNDVPAHKQKMINKWK